MNKNNRTALNIVMIIAGMVMIVCASPSLYKTFCRATGIDGTPQRVSKASETTLSREIDISFDTNVDPRLSWKFEPDLRKVRVKIGENKLVYFHAENTGKTAVTGRATYNVSPEKTAIYFNKVQCFCFENQTIQAGQKVEFPVSFFIDPEFVNNKFMDDVKGITLSYTFYLSDKK